MSKSKNTPGDQAVMPSIEMVADIILTLRGRKVMIDADLARLYGVTTKRLNQQVSRNADRFPADFMFELSPDEKQELVANCNRFNRLKHSTALPHAFTEHGALMAANVLNSPQAVQCSILVVRAFVQMRELLLTNVRLAAKVDQLEARLDQHDEELQAVIEAIRQLAAPPDPPERRRIGFTVKEEHGRYTLRPSPAVSINPRRQ